MAASEIYCLLGSIFHVLSFIFLTTYVAKFPWNDTQSKADESGNYAGTCDTTRPHGGMYSDYWWGSRFLTSAFFGLFALLFLSVSSVFQTFGLLSFSPKTRFFNIQIASLMLSVSSFLTFVSAVVYTTIFPYNNKYDEENNFKITDCGLNYLYWNTEWYQFFGYLAFLSQVLTGLFYTVSKVAKWKEVVTALT